MRVAPSMLYELKKKDNWQEIVRQAIAEKNINYAPSNSNYFPLVGCHTFARVKSCQGALSRRM